MLYVLLNLIQNCYEVIIKNYFDKLEDLHKRYEGGTSEHIWNIDEKGIQMVKRAARNITIRKVRNMSLKPFISGYLYGITPYLWHLGDDNWGRF